MVRKHTLKYNPEDELELEDICEYLGLGRAKVFQLLRHGDIVAGKLGRKWKAYFKNVLEYKKKVMEGGAIQRNLGI